MEEILSLDGESPWRLKFYIIFLELEEPYVEWYKMLACLWEWLTLVCGQYIVVEAG